MRADGVVDFFPVAEFAVEFFHFQRARRDLVELLGMGAIGAFDGAVEFWGNVEGERTDGGRAADRPVRTRQRTRDRRRSARRG
jgi:hypothetical protein